MSSQQKPASAVERAATVLVADDDAILHVVVVETQTAVTRTPTAR